jgi:uncharacterized protein (TIGR00251 family)
MIHAMEVSEVRVRVQPRARSTEIAGERRGVLLVRVSAPPTDGKANDAVRKLIARSLGVPVGRVSIVRGAATREKSVRVEGFSREGLWKALLERARGR